MEGAHPEVLGLGADEFGDAVAHLAGGFVGEGECEDAEGVDAELEEVGDAVGQRACLAAAGAGNYHDGALGACRGLALWFIQLCKKFAHNRCAIGGAKIRIFFEILDFFSKNRLQANW